MSGLYKDDGKNGVWVDKRYGNIDYDEMKQ